MVELFQMDIPFLECTRGHDNLDCLVAQYLKKNMNDNVYQSVHAA